MQTVHVLVHVREHVCPLPPSRPRRPSGPAGAALSPTLPMREVRLRYSDVEDRFGTAWNAATQMVQGHIEDALELLETFDRPDLDDWARGVVAGCAHLRRAQDHIRRAERLEEAGSSREARREWLAAASAWQAACAEPSGTVAEPRTDLPLRFPDPWPHILELFRDHLEERRADEQRRAG